MKQLLFLILALLSVAEAKAQHSDLYNYIMNTVKPTHFPWTNAVTIKITNTRDGFSTDNQPVLVINDVEQIPDVSHNITNFTSLDVYTMAQLQFVYIWNRRGDWVQNTYGGMKGIGGVIFVYTADYVFSDPANPRTPRRLGADSNRATRIVVLENPIPNTIPTPPNTGGNKGKKGK